MTPAQRAALIALEENGRLKPETAIEEARPADSVLHDLFEWDNAVAGERHRLDQAREIIRSIRMEYRYSITEYRCPVYVRDRSLPGDETGYIRVRTVRDERALALATLMAEADAVSSRIERFRGIARELGLIEEGEERLQALFSGGREAAA